MMLTTEAAIAEAPKKPAPIGGGCLAAAWVEWAVWEAWAAAWVEWVEWTTTAATIFSSETRHVVPTGTKKAIRVGTSC